MQNVLSYFIAAYHINENLWTLLSNREGLLSRLNNSGQRGAGRILRLVRRDGRIYTIGVRSGWERNGKNAVMDKIVIYTDGGSRGNPGPAAAAFILTEKSGRKIAAQAAFLGEATNNFAEYTAVIKALEAAKSAGAKSVVVYCDSEFIVKQLNGQYKVKTDNIRPLFAKAIELLAGFGSWTIQYIPREKNSEADELVNRALNLEKDVKLSTSEQKTKAGKPVRLAVLISGGGRTMMNIFEQIKAGNLAAEMALVISSRSTVAGVERAKAAGLNVKIIRNKRLSRR